MIDTAGREKLVESYVLTGMDRARARLVIDVAVKAAEDSFAAMVEICRRVGDPMGAVAAQSVAVQLLAMSCAHRLDRLQEVAEASDLPTSMVQL